MPIPGGGVSFYPVSGGSIPPSPSIYDFSIDGLTIQDCAGEFIQEINYNDINQIDFDRYSSPLTDGGGVVGYQVNGKTIDMSMVLLGVSESDLNDKISYIKTSLYGKEKTLQVVVDGVPRVAKVNLLSLRFNQTQANKKLLTNVQAQFRAMNDFERLTAQTSSFLGITGDWTEDIINIGEKVTEGKVYMIFNAGIANLNEVSIEVNGYTVQVNQAITDGDVLIFDGIEKEVTLNGVKIPYLGPVDLLLEVGSNLMTFAFEVGSTVDVDITTLYRYKYL